MIALQRIISGGQTGVDQTALAVARACGYQTGGTVPKGWRTDEGPMPSLGTLYGCTESYAPEYNVRTIQNVRDADATVWFGLTTSPGFRVTHRMAQIEIARRPYVWVANPDADSLILLLAASPIVTLNVAGNRRRIYPEAAEQARAVLTEVLQRIRTEASRRTSSTPTTATRS